MGRRVAVLAVVLALAAPACDSGDPEPGATPPPTTSAPVPPTGGAGQTTGAPKAAARWETVTTFTGTGATQTPEFQILPTAIQWRVRWTCETGRLRITTQPPPRRPAATVDEGCPREGTGFSILTGPVRLAVEVSMLQALPPARYTSRPGMGSGAKDDCAPTIMISGTASCRITDLTTDLLISTSSSSTRR
jgi:hypothetical protein